MTEEDWKEVSEEEFELYFFLGGKGFAWKWKWDGCSYFYALPDRVPSERDVAALKAKSAVLFIPNGETNQ